MLICQLVRDATAEFVDGLARALAAALRRPEDVIGQLAALARGGRLPSAAVLAGRVAEVRQRVLPLACRILAGIEQAETIGKRGIGSDAGQRARSASPTRM